MRYLSIPGGNRRCWLAIGTLIVAAVVTTAVAQEPQVEPAESTRAKPTAKVRAAQNSPRPAGRHGSTKSADGQGDVSAAISRLAISPARSVIFTEEREAAARTFVRKNRAELDQVLEQLKVSKPSEYQQVICDLFRTVELFTAMRQEDPQRYDLSLRAWQWEAKTQLLAAELVQHPDQSERIKLEIREAVEQLADVQIEQAAYEVRKLEAKVRRAEGQRKQIEARRGDFIKERTDAILQAVQQLAAGQSPAERKSESKSTR